MEFSGKTPLPKDPVFRTRFKSPKLRSIKQSTKRQTHDKKHSEKNGPQDKINDIQCESPSQFYLLLSDQSRKQSICRPEPAFGVKRGGARKKLQNEVVGGILQNTLKLFAAPQNRCRNSGDFDPSENIDIIPPS